jgi:WhiB family redox-sensing transcriptional regulator
MVQGNSYMTTVHYGRTDGRAGGWGGSTGGAGLVADRNWRDRAACRSEDPELFFPVGDDGPALVQVAQAKAVCARCPVAAKCLSFALEALPEGIAGGLTVDERRKRRGASGSPAMSAETPFGRLPARVDELVVTRLMAGERVPASRQELAQAAVGLALAGYGCRWIGTQLGVADRQVYRWLQRHRMGKPMVPQAGRRRRASGAVAS